MKINKPICTLLSLALLLSPITIKAEDNTQEFVTGATHGTVKVKASVAEMYQITLPAQITLSRNMETGFYEGTYSVSVKANLINGEKIVVVPQDDFKLSNGNGIYSDSVVISQSKDTWTPIPSADNEIASSATEFVQTEGTIQATLSKAGTYEGDLQFTFTKINKE